MRLIIFINYLGEIQSPNYPAVYPNNMDEVISLILIIDISTAILYSQTWNLEVASDKKILLTFESFDLEDENSCAYDYLQISFGSVEEKYCGSSKPSPIISSGNTMTVTFHTDHSVNGNGFKATWTTWTTTNTVGKHETSLVKHF